MVTFGKIGWVVRTITLASPPVMACTTITDPWWEIVILTTTWMFIGQMNLETAYNRGIIETLREKHEHPATGR